MAIEADNADYVGDWDAVESANKPTTNVGKRSDGAEVLRHVKKVIKDSFSNVTGAVTASHTELNLLDGVTATTAELNYVDGVTSAIQTQIDNAVPNAGYDYTDNDNVAMTGSWATYTVCAITTKNSSPSVMVRGTVGLRGVDSSQYELRLVRNPSGTPVVIGTKWSGDIFNTHDRVISIQAIDTGAASGSESYGIQGQVTTGDVQVDRSDCSAIEVSNT